jgi:hypothetical protein
MTRLLILPIATLFTCVFAAPANANEPPGLADRVERLGVLPAELVKAKKTDAEIVESLVLATLHRMPTEEEKTFGAKHLAAAKDRAEAARDIVWAMINTKEFVKLNGMDKDLHAALHFLNSLTEKWGKKEKEKK